VTVYIIRAGRGPVKIGYTSKDVADRIIKLQCAHYEPLRLVRVLEGGREVETWLHFSFATRHIRNEWFTWCPEMMTIEPPAVIDAGGLPSGAPGRAGWGTREERLSYAERRRRIRTVGHQD
jgi:hypothetical protein